MSASNGLTFQKLAQIAIGNSELGEVNIAVLRGLIDALLRKLNCSDEKVTITGVTGMHLLTLLNKSSPAPLTIDNQSMQGLSKKNYHCLSLLEEKIKDIEMKEENHLRAANCEDSSTVPHSGNEFSSKIAKNELFQEYLEKVSTKPFEEAFNKMELKVKELENSWKILISRGSNGLAIMQGIELCLSNIVKVDRALSKQKTLFLSTVSEIQEIMGLKVNNKEVSEFKKVVLKRFAYIDEEIEKKPKYCLGTPALALVKELTTTLPGHSINESPDPSIEDLKDNSKCCCDEKTSMASSIAIPFQSLARNIDTSLILRHSTTTVVIN